MISYCNWSWIVFDRQNLICIYYQGCGKEECAVKYEAECAAECAAECVAAEYET